MSHSRAITPRSAIIRAMSRFAVIALFVGLAGFSSCTKTPANQEVTPKPEKRLGEKKLGDDGIGATKGGNTAPGGGDERFRLAPDEGKLSLEPPADAKAGGEANVKLTLTAGDKYKVNTEFPTKITLETTEGVTIAKAELRAGGHDKDKGDADVFDEHQMVFEMKMTPASAGSYTVNGIFKFAVCDKAGSTCLAKKEPIAIQLAAK